MKSSERGRCSGSDWRAGFVREFKNECKWNQLEAIDWLRVGPWVATSGVIRPNKNPAEGNIRRDDGGLHHSRVNRDAIDTIRWNQLEAIDSDESPDTKICGAEADQKMARGMNPELLYLAPRCKEWLAVENRLMSLKKRMSDFQEKLERKLKMESAEVPDSAVWDITAHVIITWEWR